MAVKRIPDHHRPGQPRPVLLARSTGCLNGERPHGGDHLRRDVQPGHAAQLDA